MSLSQVACTSSSLPPYEANYTTKMRGIRINSERQFTQIAEDTYRLSWSAKALWMRIKESSEFKIIDDKVIPLSYNYTRKGLGSDRPVNVVFDWASMQATGTKGKASTSYALLPGTLDKLSFQVQMQLDLLNNASQRNFSYPIGSHNGLRTYDFGYEKAETIDTELGEFSTLVFRRDKKDASIRLWMSPKQFYLPVKVQQSGKDANTVVIKSWKSERENVISDSELRADDGNEQILEVADSFADDIASDIDEVDTPMADVLNDKSVSDRASSAIATVGGESTDAESNTPSQRSESGEQSPDTDLVEPCDNE